MIKDYKEQREYKVVKELITEMGNDGTISRFQGACLPASEIVQAILHSRNVKSKLLECTALVVNSNTQNNSIHFIGFDSLVPLKPYETDTHIILLVEAEVPFIIDASIGHKMGGSNYVVVSPLDNSDPEIISKASYKGSEVTYRIKKNLRFFNIHQKNLTERLESERQTQLDIRELYGLVKVSILIGIFNIGANSILIILKAVFP